MPTAGRRTRRILIKNNLNNRIYEIIRIGVGIIFPPRCPVCDQILDRAEDYIHEKCVAALFPVEGRCCMHCGRMLSVSGEYCPDCGRKKNQNVISFKQGKALWQYRGQIKRTMYRFKYSNKREYAYFFAKMAAGKYGTWIKSKDIEAIVPVPMHRRKERRRGYNQAMVFADYLGRELGLPVAKNLVCRVRDTAPMKNLNDKERKKNLKNAFQIKRNIVQYSYILVVDDIYTTGSTADALTDVLIQSGVKEVYFLSICTGQEI